VKLCTER